MIRDIYEEEHRIFREGMRKFIEQEVAPHHEAWEREGNVSREVWLKAGENGFLGLSVPEEYGGLGVADFRYNNVVSEELKLACMSGPGFTTHTDIIVPYIVHYGTDAQKKKYLPGTVSGECITSIAMTEPNTGSDLAGIRTTAERVEGGYRLNGQKTFITNGYMTDLCIVVARTNSEEKHRAFSLLLVERDFDGFEQPKKLKKIGLHAQDTSELFFKDVFVPEENLLGEEDRGFYCLVSQLPQERLSIAVEAQATAEAALDQTLQYCKEREAFGRPIGTFQNTRFKLAEMKTEVEIGRLLVNELTMKLNRGEMTAEEGAMVKYWTTEMCQRLLDGCLQFHGGYGYMMEYPIAKFYIDSRARSIFGGTNEIMREIIGRGMGLDDRR